jgi:hypothetical protein
MNKIQTLLVVAAAGILGGISIAAMPHAAQAQAGPEFRTGGCTGCFATQMEAALAQFSNVTKVYRLCATGNNVGGSTNVCAGAAGLPAGAGAISAIQDYAVIEGTLKNCGTSCDAKHLGVNGGGFARYYVSANASYLGVDCASNPKQNIGFLGIFGADQAPGGGDDPGNGTGAVGIPPNWPTGAGPTYDMSLVPRAALVQCNTTIQSQFWSKLPLTVDLSGHQVQPTWSVVAGTELCVVDVDADGNGQINNRDTGRTPGFTTIGATETSDLAQACNAGFSDLPSTDFEDPSINTRTYDDQQSTGAQIFKIVAHKSVSAASDTTKKIVLNKPQLETLFGGTNTGTDACSWKDLGGQVNGDPAAKITICYREDGSGTRETYRNTFMLNTKSSHAQGVATTGTLETRDCRDIPENWDGVTQPPNTPKPFSQESASSDEATCVSETGFASGFTGAVGYVNSSRTNANWYAVPVFGIDPDAQSAVQMRNLVECGLYPYWGPLTGGKGAAVDTGGFRAAHLAALSSQYVFDASVVPDYLPLGPSGVGADGVAFIKTQTDGAYGLKYAPLTTDCIGVVPNPINPHP